MRVMLLHKLAEHILEDYVPPQKLIADVGKMVSDPRDAGLLRRLAARRRTFPPPVSCPSWARAAGRAPKTKARGCSPRALPLLGSNQDSPDPESAL
jgi:hypothetical protein